MSTPYGGNNPQQWGYPPPQPPPGYPPQYGQQPGYPPPQPYGQPTRPYHGQEPPDFGVPRTPRQGHGKLLWILVPVVLVVLAALGVTGFWKPGFFVPTVVLDQTALQNGVRETLKGYGATADAVSCPPDREVKPGNTFTCTATIKGKQQPIIVTVLDTNGNYQVGRPPPE
ncbi:DUF4333 domain-containing protein [Amycolatopsis pithecellobii]|uniref:DUF4333 domain-containing protein n=1 Tax=Amycolatopsis pithecellobii TaxID=664692 RepID=A0A6N7Z764_9PSEU|nr:DUF4333 domain-containing protein [Amycolatopsis pithecellobii]MTD56840.1 DUF4333 domain-containing protein [Amycolatopsis pithecellobii]